MPMTLDKEIVKACCLTPDDDALACSNDNLIVRWQVESEVWECDQIGPVCTAVHWVPSAGKQKADKFAIPCADGTFFS